MGEVTEGSAGVLHCCTTVHEGLHALGIWEAGQGLLDKITLPDGPLDQ